jgi:Fur family ferric uptake transcriptional regulator
MKLSYETLLKDHGLSLTSVRMTMLDVLTENPHADANLIFEHVQRRITAASKQAIYNNLNTLVEHKLIREIKPKGQPSLYEISRGDNHQHIVCRACQRVLDCHLQITYLTPSEHHGFAIDEAEVTFWGICPSCQKINSGENK